MRKQKAEVPAIYRRFQFCAGHRVHEHESKCRHLHGHNYVAHVWCAAAQLDKLGRVIDFSVVKQLIGGWIDEHWDHAFIAYAADEEALQAVRMVHGQRLYVMHSNPTVENMANELLVRANAVLRGTGVSVVRVQLAETENCGAEAIA